MTSVDDEICIRLSVPESQTAETTGLYCEAFLDKLSPLLGTAERAVPFLASCIVPDRAFVALWNGAVLGVAGFKLSGKGLFEPSVGQFLRAYGMSAPLRLFGLILLERNENADSLLMDGIAVREGARGRGVGTRLLHAIENHARSLGKTTVRLDVIDTNPGARRLYERLGFRRGKTAKLGRFGVLFAFRSATTIQKTLGAAASAAFRLGGGVLRPLRRHPLRPRISYCMMTAADLRLCRAMLSGLAWSWHR